jgi:phage FluMu protein Com
MQHHVGQGSQTIRLFCPKCAEVLLESPAGVFECKPGRMQLSVNLSRGFRSCYVLRERLPRDEPFGQGIRVGGSWYCPGCGVPTEEANPGDVRCPRCRLALNEFIYQLSELHPHLKADDAAQPPHAGGGVRHRKR